MVVIRALAETVQALEWVLVAEGTAWALASVGSLVELIMVVVEGVAEMVPALE